MTGSVTLVRICANLATRNDVLHQVRTVPADQQAKPDDIRKHLRNGTLKASVMPAPNCTYFLPRKIWQPNLTML
ncbi:MAG: hypothetical protein IPP13_14010 [Kouleothrix sp.]|nr:hypothetical protein [Kouleothrix sp.]